MGEMIGLCAIIAPFVMVVLIIWINVSKKREENKIKADLYSQAIEKGQILPENFFADNNSKKPVLKSLRNGIICISTGIGISLFFITISLIVEDDALGGAPIGIIPFFIGLGFLIIHFLEKKQQTDAGQ
ncbi:MAG: DUF6249 domain-containing protein [Bacteroidales bacterium]|jgi:hypothetical protein|nr:DUF6249 domain-containing protein [Bacteroidales bacterium]